MMDKQELIKKYKQKEKKRTPLWLLGDGSTVIGEEVDENNRLNYVIQKGDKIFIEYAGKHRPVANLAKRKSITITVSMKNKNILPIT
jgi:hypothetical protein